VTDSSESTALLTIAPLQYTLPTPMMTVTIYWSFMKVWATTLPIHRSLCTSKTFLIQQSMQSSLAAIPQYKQVVQMDGHCLTSAS
jgi:hypothetical protein